LSRRIDRAVDAAALFDHVADGGRCLDRVLFESAATATRVAERSLIMSEAAARVTCRDRQVEVRILSESGRPLVDRFVAEVDGGFPARVETVGDTVVLTFDDQRPRGEDLERLMAITPIDVVRRIAGLVDGPAIVPGIFGYDLVDHYETLPPPLSDPLDFPDFVFWVPRRWVEVHPLDESTIASVGSWDGAPATEAELDDLCQDCERAVETSHAVRSVESAATPSVDVDLDDVQFARCVESIGEHIRAGDLFQAVPSRTFRTACDDAFGAYLELRRSNPSPYMFFLTTPDGTLFGASPETAVKVDAEMRRVELGPLAGTRPRGRTPSGAIDPDLDNRLEADLRLSVKETAEHMMLVDLARNDVARVSVAGTRQVENLLSVQRYSHVMHLGSRVIGTLRPELDALHAYVAAMNMGTLVGAPKLEATRVLRELEPTRRGPYGGAVGYLDTAGGLNTAITIRAGFVRGGVAYVRAGAGVVADSIPVAEADETRHKAAAVLEAIARGGRAGSCRQSGFVCL
jgi:anthranilate synthase component 1